MLSKKPVFQVKQKHNDPEKKNPGVVKFIESFDIS